MKVLIMVRQVLPVMMMLGQIAGEGARSICAGFVGCLKVSHWIEEGKRVC